MLMLQRLNSRPVSCLRSHQVRIALTVQVLDMMPMADSVTKLTSQCAYCAKEALFSLRTAASEQQEVVGGADLYQPVCRACYTARSGIKTSKGSKPESVAGLERSLACLKA